MTLRAFLIFAVGVMAVECIVFLLAPYLMDWIAALPQWVIYVVAYSWVVPVGWLGWKAYKNLWGGR